MIAFRLAVVALALLAPSLALGQDAAAADALGEGAAALADEVRDVPVATTVRLVLVLTSLTFLPAVLLVMTPFTRFIVVFAMLRQAVGLQSAPPNQVLVGLALFLSILLMQPTIDQVRTQAFDPFMAGELQPGEALDAGLAPLREFMLANTRRSDMEAVLQMGRMAPPEDLDELPTPAVASAFVLSELKSAFVIGVKIYIPFLVVDIIIANVLLSMGMMVLPPVVISMPFKLLLFVLMDGWGLLVRSLAVSFAM